LPLSPDSIRFKPFPFIRAVSLAALIVSVALAALLAPRWACAKTPAHLTFDSNRFEFGKVEEGVQINHTFTVKNTGGSTLRIFDVSATCGCTIPKLSKKTLLPGESTKLRIVIDTAMKQDAVTKKVLVTSNDPAHRVSTLWLRLDVKDPHIGMSNETAAKIFSNERCAACHVAQGVGLFGRELYRADCAMCHGVKAAGAVGPPLLGPYETTAYSDKMRAVLSNGSKTHRSMPGFLAEAGGPLDKSQIDSILKYLSELSHGKPK
jgi:cytochrome c5